MTNNTLDWVEKPKKVKKNLCENSKERLQQPRDFSLFRFFLYKLESQTEISVGRELAYLGAKQTTFFSAKECSHVITLQEHLDKEPKEDVLIKAKRWKKPIWSLEYAQGVFRQLKRRHRPVYYEFPGYYLMIEDATGQHCAINIKEYPGKGTVPKMQGRKGEKRANVMRAIRALDEDCLLGASSVETKGEERPRGAFIEKKQALYCETCKVRCEDLKEHLKTASHLEAYGKNDFSELDSLLGTLRRRYRGPLPSYMKENVNPTVDGSQVEFES